MILSVDHFVIITETIVVRFSGFVNFVKTVETPDLTIFTFCQWCPIFILPQELSNANADSVKSINGSARNEQDCTARTGLSRFFQIWWSLTDTG
ncbi:MAG: hypothetical protein COB40_06535 [Marinosulfonomonas sp.]|nr:MAG: hypothetical protein COB40_06535 [Marinosulfonomonas sp.]